ncbi:hypothetical protein BFL36_01440 [Clavibacter michiganensis]|uniref:Uncharacterized protein n=1 Tax=Clavibacter michiganensis TaxID=28447 RepID=A0A251YW93_9MICO|nr:hypothetical protein BFL36_01440 [Clavibacter michiganensis]
MVAVARDRVEAAELVGVLLRGGAHGVERPGDPRGRPLRRRGRVRDGVLRLVGLARVHRLERGSVERAAAEGRGVGGRGPEPLELVVEPEQGERGAGHVEAGAELADLRIHEHHARLLQQVRDAGVDDEQLLGLHGAEAVEHGHDAGAAHVDPVRDLRGHEQVLHEQLGQAVRGRDVGLVDAGLAVDPEADRHAPLGHREQRLVGARQRAAGEGDAHRAGARVGEAGDALGVVEVVARGGRGARGLEHGEVARDPAALGLLVGGCAEDVVRHDDRAAVDPVAAHPLLRLVEVQHVARVVAVEEERAAALLAGADHGLHLVRRGRREQVAHRGAVGEARADEAAERGVVPGAAADDHGHLGLGGARRAGDAAVHAAHPAAVGADEAVRHVVRELRGVVPQSGHPCSPPRRARERSEEIL